MPRIVADRFVATRQSWIDLATGAPVRLRLTAAGSSRAQIEWSARCEVLANLRHPLINPLVDYGAADRAHVFEAYAVLGPVHGSGAAAEALLAHSARFLQSHDVHLPRPLAEFVLRPVVRGPARRIRPLGVFLQRRGVFEAIADALEAARPGGACAIAIEGAHACGLRTTRLATARAARLRGYVTLSAAALRNFPWVVTRVLDRHVCVIGGDEAVADPDIACLLARLGSASARRHLVISFSRPGTDAERGVVQMDQMGVTAMAAMVFVDRHFGPSPDEVFAAARTADGRPGRCLAQLGLDEYQRRATTPMVVHESPQIYEAAAAPMRAASPGRRREGTPGVMQRSCARAEVLARAGRHVAAQRVLRRAARVFGARGDRDEAARALLLLGWLQLDRAHVAAAADHFQQARDTASSAALALTATVGLGVAWTDDGRLVDGEAALRTVLLAAEHLRDHDLCAHAAAALGRCLFWHGRLDEAMAVLRSSPDSASAAARARVRAIEARVHVVEGLIPAAVRSARAALEIAAPTGDARIVASAYRGLAAAVASAGDRESAAQHLAEGVRVAAAAHLPLAVIRLRLTAADVGTPEPDRSRGLRVAGRIAAHPGEWPPLLHFIARAVLARVAGTDLDPATKTFISTTGATTIARPSVAPQINPVADLETFLNLAHAAADDRAALEQVATELHTRLRTATVLVVSGSPDRRVLAQSGRSWHGDPHIAWRALGAGLSVPVDTSFEPAQAAEPLRYGGDVIGAVAVRWTAGTIFEVQRATALLRVAALAMAATVRAVLDRGLPAEISGSWGDLLGDSAPARSLRDAIARAARAPFPVLIQGESGSGKELVARAVHRLGARRERKFCALNCAALSDELIEAELFGHARGAFTGAVGERAGLFEEADGGTLFLDEIGELSARAQAKLLRVLQDGEVRRVGENVSRRVDVRIVAATNRRLDQEAAAGRFRTDLRFRLDVVRIEVPPLRERTSDVPMLAARFWDDAAARVGSRATLAPDTIAALARYDWPGNVRELQNVIAWMAVHSPRRGRVGPAAVPQHVAHAGVQAAGTFEVARAEFERRFVKAALASAGGQRVKAAGALGVTRQGLAKMMRRLGIEQP